MKSLILIAVMAVMVLAGCSGSSAAPAGADKPVIKNFSADPAVINSGDSTQIIWQVSNATQVIIDNGIGAVALTGAFAVKPTGDVTYKMTATNAAGSASAVVTVKSINQGGNKITAVSAGANTAAASTGPLLPGKPVVSDFSARPTSTPTANKTTLSWTVINADTVTIDRGIGNVSANGAVNVKPAETTIYTLTALNKAGSVTASTEVRVGAPAVPVIRKFMSNPSTIVLGKSSTISWEVTDADYVKLSGGDVPDAGSMLVYPGSTIVYSLVATNSGGSVQSTCQVTVQDP